MDNSNPLLLTLNINDEAQQYFNASRQQYFPPERNFLNAHLMLFHQLPANEQVILDDIKITALKHHQMTVQVTELVNIGRGVAFKVVCPELAKLHSVLQREWTQWLIPQDRQKLWPHITIQNKVTPDEAKALLSELSAAFKPFAVTGTGLSLWEYQGGPWSFVEKWEFDSLL